jgi:hypothetical protein
VILALASVERHKRVTVEEQTTLKKAAEHLDFALAGHDWLDNPRFSQKASTYASFFGQAVKALPSVTTSGAFVRNLAGLKETAAEIASGKLPDEKKVTALRAFFFNASQAELDRTEQLLNHETEPSALSLFDVTEDGLQDEVESVENTTGLLAKRPGWTATNR